MVVKDEEKKEETTKAVGEVEEKRIKPAVIRRRAAKPKVEAAPETVAEVPETEAKVGQADTGVNAKEVKQEPGKSAKESLSGRPYLRVKRLRPLEKKSLLRS